MPRAGGKIAGGRWQGRLVAAGIALAGAWPPVIHERCILKGKMYVWRHPCF